MIKLLLPFILTCSTLRAIDPVEAPPAPAKVPQTFSVGKKAELFEYQGDEIGLVLRTLARQMHMNLIIHERIQGNVTLRITEKTPREVFDVIVEANGYKSYDKKGVTYVVLKNQEKLDATRDIAREKKALFDAFVAEGFSKEEAFKLLLAGIQPTR